MQLGTFVYVDESGDTGFKFRKGSSRYFIVAMLIIPDPIPLNAAIDDLRVDLHYTERTEFKFVHSSDSVRKRLLQIVSRHDVLVRSLVVDKQLLTYPHMHDRSIFYNYMVKQLLKFDGGRLKEARLILDEREKGKKSKQGLGTYLRRELNGQEGGSLKIRDIRYHESHRDNLLQAVDMACGAINALYVKDNQEYWKVIQSKIDDIWEFQPY